VRKLAVTFAQRFKEEQHPKSYHGACRALVRQPHLAPHWYREALVQANTACRLDAQNAAYRATLGMTQYRLGKHAEAVETLRQPSQDRAPTPASLAFLAMAHYQVGKKDKAADYLMRLRELMKDTHWAKDEEAQGFLRETEEMIDGQAKPTGE
jgi:hypothetical protein